MTDILNFNSSNGSGSNYWNYGHPERDNYTLSISGDVVEIREVQSLDFKTKQPAFYDDGNPRMEINVVLALPDGSEIIWPWIRPKGAAMTAFQNALINTGFAGESLREIGGLTIKAETQQPPQGFSYGQKNPRPFRVTILGEATHPFRGVVNMVKKDNKPAPAPAAQQPQGWTNDTNPVNHAAQQAAQSWGQQPNVPQYSDEDIPWS